MLKLNKLPLLFPWKHNKTKIMAEDAMDGGIAEPPVVVDEELQPCSICGRTFLPPSLATHSRVCERNATRKRKVFDSLKQRVEGTDLAPFHQKTYLKKAETSAPVVVAPTTRPSKWKEKHIELVNAIRAAKGVPSTTMPSPPKRSSTTLGTPNHERCPSCERHFGPKAYDRHVEWCKERRTTIHKSPASVVMAKERLEARTKYKVPPLNKSKRALTREKYSPQMSRTESVVSMKSSSACALDRSPSIRKSKTILYPKKSVDKIEQHVQKFPEKLEKMEKSASETKTTKDIETHVTKETKKTAQEPVKSSHSKRTLPLSKINNTSVNLGVQGLTVSSLDAKKMMTWKDTVNVTKSEEIYLDVAREARNLTSRSEDRSVVKRRSIQTIKKAPLTPKKATKSLPPPPNTNSKLKQNNPLAAKNPNVILEQQVSGKDETAFVTLQEVATCVNSENSLNLKSSSLEITEDDECESIAIKVLTSSKCVGCDESSFKNETHHAIDGDDKNRPSDNCQLKKIYPKFQTVIDIKETPSELKLESERIGDSQSTLTDDCISDETPLEQQSSNDFFKNIQSNKINENILINEEAGFEKDIFDVDYYNRQLTGLREKLFGLDADKKHDLLEIQSPVQDTNEETAVGKLIDFNVNSCYEDNSCNTPPEQEETLIEFCEEAPYNDQQINLSNVQYKDKLSGDIKGNTDHLNKLCTNQVKRNYVENSSDDQMSCIERYKIDKKKIYCEKFLERNRLIGDECFLEYHRQLDNRYTKMKPTYKTVDENVLNTESRWNEKCNEENLGCSGENNKLEEESNNNVCKDKAMDNIFDSIGENETEFNDFHNPDYSDSLDNSGSVISDDFKDDHGDVGFSADKIKDSSSLNKDKTLYVWQENADCFSDYESVMDGYENEHSLALSVARIEREIRKCCSDICLHKSSESSFVSYTDIDLKKFSSHECTNIHNEPEIEKKMTTDEILEIAGEEFVNLLKTPIVFGRDFITSSPIPHKKVASPTTTDIPTKRRKIDEENTETCVDSLIKNIEHIRMRKVDKEKEEMAKTSEELFKDMVKNGVDVMNRETDESENDKCLSTKRILSTIEEAPSNGSSVLPLVIEKHCKDIRHQNEIESSRISSDEALRFTCGKTKLPREKSKVCSQRDGFKTPKSRPASGTNSSSVSPRFLHIIRSIINPKLTVTPRELYSAQEDIVRISRRHCQKILKMNREEIDKICQKELLTLPKITQQKKTAPEKRKASPRPKVHLPKINNQVAMSEGKASAYAKFAMPFVACGTKIPVAKLPDLSLEKPKADVAVMPQTDSVSLDYNPFLSAERQLKELLECDDLVSSAPTSVTKQHHITRPHTTPATVKNKITNEYTKKHTKAADKSNKLKSPAPKRASVIDPPASFQDRYSMLNDDFEMLENLINDNYNRENEIEIEKNVNFSLSTILSQRKYSDDISTIDPRLINENDNLSIPDSLKMGDLSPSSDMREIKLQQSITMLDDECLEDAQIDEFMITLCEADFERPPERKPKAKKGYKAEKSNVSLNSSFGYSGNAGKDKKKNLTSLKRSISLLDPVQKPKPLKNRQDVQNYFKEQKSPSKIEKNIINIELPKVETIITTKSEEKPIITPKPEELFSVDDEMYEEYKKYEELYLKEKEEMLKREERKIGDGHSGVLTASEDDDGQNVNKVSDSAYGSLNRKTPKVRARSTKLTPLESHRILIGDSASSSGSESSPAIGGINLGINTQKMSKFCHECGNRYPLTTAKFCVECGVKRLVL